MSPEELRALCLSFNAAVEDFPFTPETSVFKVLGKLFALTRLDAQPLKVNLKCDPEDAIRLREEHDGLIIPGYHMNKRHWNTVTVDGDSRTGWSGSWSRTRTTWSWPVCRARSGCASTGPRSAIRGARYEVVVGRAWTGRAMSAPRPVTGPPS